MRKILLVLTLSLLAVSAFAEMPEPPTIGAEAALVQPSAQGAETAPAPGDVLFADPAEGVETLATCDDAVIGAVAKASASCPYGSPYCYRDSDCDAYCGMPGWGVCEFHHWSGCCVCLG